AAALAARPDMTASSDTAWIETVAAATGMSFKLLDDLRALIESGALSGDAPQAVAALMKWIREQPLRLMEMARPESLEGLFGDSYKRLATDRERAVVALDSIDVALPVWMS